MEECNIGSDLAPHVLLAIMWAAISNSVPAVFWSVAFLLLPQHAHHRAAVEKELPDPKDDLFTERLVQVCLCLEVFCCKAKFPTSNTSVDCLNIVRLGYPSVA